MHTYLQILNSFEFTAIWFFSGTECKGFKNELVLDTMVLTIICIYYFYPLSFIKALKITSIFNFKRNYYCRKLNLHNK